MQAGYCLRSPRRGLPGDRDRPGGRGAGTPVSPTTREVRQPMCTRSCLSTPDCVARGPHVEVARLRGLDGDEGLVRSRRGRQPGGHIDWVAHRGEVNVSVDADRTDEGDARVHPDADGQPGLVRSTGRLDQEGASSTDRRFGMSLARQSRNEDGDDLVADELVDDGVVLDQDPPTRSGRNGPSGS